MRSHVLALCVAILCLIGAPARSEPVVIYERPMTEQERNAPHIAVIESYIKLSLNVEDMRKHYLDVVSAGQMPADQIKVEYIAGGPGATHNTLRFYSITPRYLKQEQETLERNQWIAKVNNGLLLKIDEQAYREIERYREVRRLDPATSMYYPGMKSVGLITQVFETVKDKRPWSMTLYDTTPYEVTTHELTRLVIHLKYEGVQTPIGWVYVYRNPDAKAQGNQAVAGAAWISGKHHVIYVGGNGIDINEIIAAVGKQYPSSLASAPQIDKTLWGREEVNMLLEDLGNILSKSDSYNAAAELQVGRLMQYLNQSVVTLDSWHKQDFDGKKQTQKEWMAWWQAHRDQYVWNEKKDQLMMPGADKVAVAPKPVPVPTPMTEAEIAAATDKLMSIFESGMEKDVAQLVSAVGKDQVRWEHKDDSTWILEHPQVTPSGRNRRTFTGPTIENRNDLRVPLAGVFNVESDALDGTKPHQYQEKYYYYRIENQWSRRAPEDASR